MRIGALALGIVGGLLGVMSAVTALLLGGIGGAFDAEGSGTIVGLGFSALVFCFLGFLGAGLALAKPRIAGLLLLVSAIGITISISLFAVLAAPLFLIAAILAFLGKQGDSETIVIQASRK
jgi:hypothetical protein